MAEIRKTQLFADWLDNLRDLRARARVQVRIERLARLRHLLDELVLDLAVEQDVEEPLL